jgi:hypothetical protein
VKRNVLVTAGRETVVEFTPQGAVEPPSEGGGPKTRKIIGGVAMGVGAVLGAIAVYEAIHWVGLQSDGEDRAKLVPKETPERSCKEYGDPVCIQIDKDSKTASVLAWTLGGAGVVALGVGAYLFFSDSGSSEGSTKAATAPKPKTRVVPQLGGNSGGVMVLGTF